MPQAPGSPQCPGWVARWLQETQGKQHWGFAQYTDHGRIRERLREEDHLYEDEIDEEVPRILENYDRQVDKVISSTLEAAGCGDSMFEQFELQDIAWPQSSIDQGQARWNAEAEEARERDLDELDMLEDDSGDEDLDLEDKALGKRDKLFLAKQKYLDKEEAGEFEGDARLRANLRVLRSRFKAARDLPRRSAEEKEEKKEGEEERNAEEENDDNDDPAARLHMGILGNVFIVIDKTCVDSQNFVGGGWVFAVDPDYEDPGPMEPLALKVKTKYRGFMRVRMHHLVNEFFDLRKYNEKGSSLKALWRVARKSGGGYFAPDEEVHSRSK